MIDPSFNFFSGDGKQFKSFVQRVVENKLHKISTAPLPTLSFRSEILSTALYIRQSTRGHRIQ